MRRLQSATLVAAMAFVLACSADQDAPTGPRSEADGPPQLAVSDATHGGNPHFYWRSPVATSGPYHGEFDASQHPIVTVCKGAAEPCSNVVRIFVTAPDGGTDAVRVVLKDQQYVVNWVGTGGAVTDGLYRISVLIDLQPVGYVDVGIGKARVRGAEYQAQRGQTIPIKFRIEKGATSVLPVASEGLVTKAKALVTSEDPASAYQDLLNDLSALYDEVGAVEGSRRLKAISERAFGDMSASATQTLVTALGNKTYDIGNGQFAAPQAAVRQPGISQTITPSFAAAEASRTPITLLYVNGVFNDPLDAAQGALNTWALARARLGWRFFSSDSPYRTRYFYNPSGILVVPGAGVLADLIESQSQIKQILSNSAGTVPQAASLLAAQIATEFSDKHGVLLITHSQGNLMAQQALASVTRKECVAVNSVAPPTSAGWPSALAGRTTMIARQGLAQDILLHPSILPLVPHGDQTLPTEHAGSYDLWLSLFPASVRGSFAYQALEFGLDLDLHAYESYSSDAVGAPVLANNLSELDGALVRSCAFADVTIAPTSLSMTISETASLSATVTDADGQVVESPTVTWSSLSPGVVGVAGSSSSATVTALSPGIAKVVAQSEGVADTATITVTSTGLSNFPAGAWNGTRTQKIEIVCYNEDGTSYMGERVIEYIGAITFTVETAVGYSDGFGQSWSDASGTWFATGSVSQSECGQLPFISVADPRGGTFVGARYWHASDFVTPGTGYILASDGNGMFTESGFRFSAFSDDHNDMGFISILIPVTYRSATWYLP